MPSPTEKCFYLELDEFSLVAARVSLKNSPPVLEDLREARIDNAAVLGETLDAVFGTRESPLPVDCALRPPRRILHLATAEEARSHKTPAAIAGCLGGLPGAAAEAHEVCAIVAASGQVVDGAVEARWFAAAAARPELDALLAKVRDWKLSPRRVESASLAFADAARIGMAAAGSARPMMFWEVGEAGSHLVSVGNAGVTAVRRLGFGFDRIVDAVMAELNLKFKGSAAKLFFNDAYDFSETGPRIASRLAGDLQKEIEQAAAEAGGPPEAFACVGLPGKQDWLGSNLAAALKIAHWRPDPAAWCSQAGLGGLVLPPQMTSSLFGLFSLVAARAKSGPAASAWHPLWVPNSEPASAAPAPAEAPASRSAPVVKPAAEAPVAAKAAPVVAKAAPAPAPAAQKPVPAREPVPAAKPAAAKAAPSAAPAAKAASAPAKTATSAEAKAASARPATAVAPAKPEAKASAAAPGSSAPARKSNLGLIVGAVAAAVVLGGGFFVYSTMQEQKRAEEARLAAEIQMKQETEARLAAELRARQEAEARAAAEREAAQKAAAAEEARQRAEQEMRLREAEAARLLNARGAIVIATEPAGATVEIGDLAPRISPATFEQMRLGRYTARISLGGFDPAQIELEVRENETANPGLVKLARQVGAIELAVTAGTRYAVSPAGVRFSVGGEGAREGIAPATLPDLPVGAYVVTLRRDGWPEVTHEVQVERSATARLEHAFSGGSLHVVSHPAGASVLKDGAPVGLTPYLVSDMPPGDVTYTLDLADHYPATVTGRVEGGQALELSSQLEPVPFVQDPGELDERAQPTKMVQPRLTGLNVPDAIVVRVAVFVDFLGHVREASVEQRLEPQLSERVIEAVKQWRFKPGLDDGRPVNSKTSVSMMINKTGR